MEILYSENSAFQHIMIIEEGNTSKSLVLDGHYQTPLPNHEYWEYILGPTESGKVTILGGGDLTSAAVLRQRGITDYTIIEIDKKVIDACAHFSKVPRGEWWPHVRVGDAVAALRDKSAAADHIVVDMLAMSRLDALTEVRPSEFIDLLTANAAQVISGFTDAGTTGILLNTILQREFYKRGWKHFSSLINSVEECFFIASVDQHEIPLWLMPNVIKYPVYPKDVAFYEFGINDALIILQEAK